MSTFEELWHDRFPWTPPVGYRLRENVPNRWVRFHSLPRSKRYPDTAEEFDTVLGRANALADQLFEEGDRFWLVASRPEQVPNAESFDVEPFTLTRFNLPKVFTWEDAQESVEDRLLWSSHAELLTWRTAAYDDIFRKIADDDECAVIFATADLSSILAPYDGGFDLILANADDAFEIESKFNFWLSDRTDSL